VPKCHQVGHRIVVGKRKDAVLALRRIKTGERGAGQQTGADNSIEKSEPVAVTGKFLLFDQ